MYDNCACGAPKDKKAKQCRGCYDLGRARAVSLRACECGRPMEQGYTRLCKKCYHREWYRNNRDRIIDPRQERARAMRDKIVNAYGARCACCNEDRRVFLTIEHKNGGGNHHRKELGNQYQFYKFLIENDFPSEFEILCMNCNWARRYGVCPHESDRLRSN